MHAGEEGDGGGAADKSVRQQSLAEEGDDEAQAREDVEREAAMAAAQKAEGTVHLDDQYAQVENAPGPLYPPTHSGTDLDVIQFGDYPADYGPHTAVRLRSQDTIVPVKLVQMSTYPIIPMQDEEGVSEHVHGDPGKPITANVLFGACLPSRLSTQPPPSPSFALFVCRPLYPPLYPPVPTISQSLLSLPFHPLRITSRTNLINNAFREPTQRGGACVREHARVLARTPHACVCMDGCMYGWVGAWLFVT